MKFCILATGLPNVQPCGGKEKRAWELKEFLESKNHEVIYICPRQSLNYFFGVWYRLLFLFSVPPKAEVYYVLRCPLGLFLRFGKKVGDFGRLWIWHWSPMVLLDNFFNVLTWLVSDMRIFNNGSHWSGFTLYPGVDLGSFKPLNIPKEYDFVFVGRDESAKGTDLFYEIVEKYPYKSFLGIGFIGRQFKNVRYIVHVHNSEMPIIYNKVGGFLMLSKAESFGIARIEAIACGLPVYTSLQSKKGLSLLKTSYPENYVTRFDKKKYLQRIYDLIVGSEWGGHLNDCLL